jgi:drug/metabolite transporter (DMT)-like permease
VASLQYTTVANNSIIFGTGPFMTAALAWLMIRERPSVATMLFACIALFGALLVVASSLKLSASALIGDGLAVLMTVAFAIKTVLTRQHRHIPMVPAACVGALMGSIGAAPFVPSWSISAGELGMFALFGFTQQGAGMILTTIGIARVPAAHAALLMALDLPMSPVWVFLFFGERPAVVGIVGGVIVALAIFGHIIVEGRRRGGAGLPRWPRLGRG